MIAIRLAKLHWMMEETAAYRLKIWPSVLDDSSRNLSALV